MSKVRTYKRHSEQTKTKAIALWKQGKTYEEIGGALGVAKGTLSDWLRSKYPRPEHVRVTQLEKARKASQAYFEDRREREKVAIENLIQSRLADLKVGDENLQRAMLAMLYWAEGSKSPPSSGVGFTNTDPELSRLFLFLFRNLYHIDESRLRVRLHLHYYHPVRETRKFWSKLLDIPESQFHAVFIKKRSRNKRFRKNFMGICMIRYVDRMMKDQIMATAYAIKDKMLR